MSVKTLLRMGVVAAAAVGGYLLFYLLFWPTGANLAAWQPQPSPGYSGVYAENHKLANLHTVALSAGIGPEHVAMGPDGWLYTGLNTGAVIRMKPDGSEQKTLANTGGRVLGLDFDAAGNVIAADAYKGLLRITPDGQVSVLTQQVSANDPLVYLDAVTVARNGLIYFTEGSHHFKPGPWGDPLAASMAEVLEQQGSGRVLVYDPTTQQTAVIASGLVFANGIVLTEDQQALLVVETGRYRVWRIPTPRNAAEAHTVPSPSQVILDNLPAFPDNLTHGSNGRYWLGLPEARSAEADQLAPLPFLRAISFRLPHALLPVPKPYGHALAFNEHGEVLMDLQDPSGAYPEVTGVTEAAGTLYVHSLLAPALGMLPMPNT